MIGPTNRVPGAHVPQIETALAFTAPGQATWADPNIPHMCGDCAHWAEGVRGVQARRADGGAMSEHNREAWLERVESMPEIQKRAGP
jgi:hypothetical protein